VPKEADLVIVGTGFASTFFLREALLHLPETFRVVVLERATSRRGRSDFSFVGDPKKFEKNVENRTPDKPWVSQIAFGGGGCWTGNTPRPHPSDFAMRSRYGIAADWPMTYDDLEPFLVEVEQAMHVAGVGAPDFRRSTPYDSPPHALCGFGRALQEAFPGQVIPMPSARASTPESGRAPCCANATCWNCPIGAKFEVAKHMADVYDDPRVELVLGAHVLEMRVEAGLVREVIFEREGREQSVHCEAAALGAHGVFNPWIALRSGLEDDFLGRYLHEQRSFDVTVNLDGVDNYDGGQQVSGLAWMFLDHEKRSEHAGCILELWNVPWLRAERGRWRQRAFLKFMFETEPQSQNRVMHQPGSKRPVVEHGTSSEWMERGIEKVPELLAQLARSVPIEDHLLHHRGQTEYHIQGTARMSASSEDGVVDADLIHHRVRNLAILGSSAFPSCPAANPTLILSALSVKSARKLFGSKAS